MKKNVRWYLFSIIAFLSIAAIVVFINIGRNTSEERDLAEPLQPISSPAVATTQPQSSPTIPALTTQTELSLVEEKTSVITTVTVEEQSPTIIAIDYIALDPENWKEWPIVPVGVSDRMRQVYREGLAKGNNPNAYSILGDCNNEPDVFMGIYDHDSNFVAQKPSNLQETVQVFKGSFDRYSPTVKKGATEGTMLWAAWNENEDGHCINNETPIDCELRVHKPSITFISLGTHYESRNEDYLRILIDKLLESGSVPIIMTKADNRELDERINQTLINLAAEYELPVWNFWKSVQDLPNRGILDEEEMYLNDEALAVQQIDGLIVLDFVYRELQK